MVDTIPNMENHHPFLGTGLVATNWFRLVVDSGKIGYSYSETLEQGFRENWTGPAGKKLVLGRPLSLVEKTNTWQTLTVKLDIEQATYKVSQFSAFSHIDWVPPSIPIRATAKFFTTGSTPVSTSWDDLPALTVQATKPPQMISQSTSHDFVFRYQEALQRDLKQALTNIPPFKVLRDPPGPISRH